MAVTLAVAAVAVPGRLGTERRPPALASAVSPAEATAAPGDPGHEELVGRLQDILFERMPRATAELQEALARAIAREAVAAAIDPLLVLAMIEVESGFDPAAASEAGAQGLMQLLPSTLRREAVELGLPMPDPLEPIANVRAGVRYLKRCMDSFPGRVELALMAYNSGPNRVLELIQDGAPPPWALAFPRRVEAERIRLRDDQAADVVYRPPQAARLADAAR